MKIILVLAIFINIIFSGASWHVFTMIRCLQIILHLPMMKTIFPANVSMIFSILVPVVMFEILSDDFPYLFFNFDEMKQKQLQNEMLDQMRNLGYETHNSILNLGSMFVFMVYIFCKCIFLLFLRYYIRKTGEGHRLFLMIYRDLFWGTFIVIFMEGYLEFLVSGALNVS